MIAYILKVTLCWLFFYGIYELFLKKRTFFIANRTYLLSTMAIGILLPLLEFIPWKTESNMAYVIYPVLMEIDDLQNIASQQTKNSFNWIGLLTAIYLIGVGVTSLRFGIGIKRIISLFKRSEKVIKKGYTLVLTKEHHLPFSFFKWVFLSVSVGLSEEVDQVMQHEIEHIKGKHSVDVLLTEFLKVVFWCSPMIYFYRNALKEVHEYLADNIVLKNTDKISYKKLLLKHTNSSLQMALTHQFFNSHLKNRLKMINQKRSGRPTLVMYALGIPVLLLLLFAFTAALDSNKIDNPDPEVPALVENIGDYFMETDPEKTPYFQINGKDIDLPLFKHMSLYEFRGSTDVILPEKAVEIFGEKARLGYVNFRNPSIKKGTTKFNGGNQSFETYMQLQLDKEYFEVSGKFNRAKKTKGSSPSAGNILQKMLLAGITDNLSQNISDSPVYEVEFEKNYDTPAFLSTCNDADASTKELTKCSYLEMVKILQAKLKYPAKAQKYEIEGSVTIKVIVTQEGKLINPEIVHDLGGNCGEAALDAVKAMTKEVQQFTPAMKDGEAVATVMYVPVVFALGNIDEEDRVSADNYWDKDKAKSTYQEIQIRKNIPPNLLQYYNEVDPSKMPFIQIEGKDIELPLSKHIVLPGKIGDVMVMDIDIAIEKYGSRAHLGYINITNIPSKSQLGRTATSDTIIEPKNYDVKGEISKVVEQMPRFPGCEDLDGDSKSKEECAKQKMLEYIYTNVKYPREAKEKGIEGMTVVQFVVTKDGDIAKVKLLREIGGGAGDEAVRVVRSMSQMSAKWIPGYQKGQAVNVVYTLPIRFKLDAGVKVVAEGNVLAEHTKSEVGDENFNLSAENVFINGVNKEDHKFNGELGKAIVIVDGKEWLRPVTEIPQDLIKSINIWKGQTAIEKYGKIAKDGVIEINTKTDQTKNNKNESKVDITADAIVYRNSGITAEEKEKPLFVINGEVVEEGKAKSLDPNDIAEIQVLKGDKAIAKYGDTGIHGVLEITTKKGPLSKRKKRTFSADEVDQVAFFPGCESQRDLSERKDCSNQNLLQYIYSNLKYPKKAAEKGIEGTVVTAFTISEEGRVTDIKVVREVEGLTKSAAAVVARMGTDDVIWEPALLEGNPVASKFILPIKYKLADDCKDCPKKVNHEIAKGRLGNRSNDAEEGELLGEAFPDIKVYPNPAAKFLNYEFTSDGEPVVVQLFDLSGKMIYESKVEAKEGRYKHQINIEGYDSEMAILRLSKNGKVYSKKVVIK